MKNNVKLLFAPDTSAGAGVATEANPTVEMPATNRVAASQAATGVGANRALATVPKELLDLGLRAEVMQDDLSGVLPFTKFVGPRLEQAGIPDADGIKALSDEEIDLGDGVKTSERKQMQAKKQGIIKAARKEHEALVNLYNTRGKAVVVALVGKEDVKLTGLKVKEYKNGTIAYRPVFKKQGKSLEQKLREAEAVIAQLKEEKAKKEATDVESEPVPAQ